MFERERRKERERGGGVVAWMTGWLVGGGRQTCRWTEHSPTTPQPFLLFFSQLQTEAVNFSPAAAARMPLCVLVGSGAKEGLTEQPLPCHGME